MSKPVNRKEKRRAGLRRKPKHSTPTLFLKLTRLDRARATPPGTKPPTVRVPYDDK